MAIPSKEEKILELFLQSSSLKLWRFEEIVRKTKMARNSVNKWLIRFQKEGIIKKIKKKNKFPYFVSDFHNPRFKAKKRLYALNKFYQTGFLPHLMNLKKAKTVVIFGSFSRADWYKGSDIDLFVFGSSEGFDKFKFQSKLKREIEVYEYSGVKEIKKISSGLIKNVINGYVVKGRIQDFAEVS